MKKYTFTIYNPLYDETIEEFAIAETIEHAFDDAQDWFPNCEIILKKEEDV